MTTTAEILPGGRYSHVRIPALPDDADVMTASFGYVAGGLYVGPLAHGSKNPGSVLGKGWPSKTFNTAQEVAATFAGTDHGPFGHMGRSGLVALDVDSPANVPDEWWPFMAAAPFQSTREQDGRRGHYVFACPPGRMLGNAIGTSRKGWGEVRGANGVIVLSPTRHEKADQGGRYQWVRTGPVPYLPDVIGDTLPDGKPGETALSDAELVAWLDEHTDTHPHGLTFREAATLKFCQWVQEDGQSRHHSAVRAARWMSREVAAGWYGSEAFGLLRDAFQGSFTRTELTEGRGSTHEWQGILAWAVGQVTDEDVTDKRARLDDLRNVELLVPRRHREPADDQETSPAGPHALTVTPRRAEDDVTEDEAEARAIERQAQLNRMLGAEMDRQRIIREAGRRLNDEEAAEELARSDFGEQYLTRSQLASIPRPEPLIEGVLARHSTAILRGRDGTYKSFVAFDWSLSIATGLPWQGRAVEQGKVLYVLGEGAPGVAARIDAWEAARGVLVDDDAFLVRVSPVNLFRGGAAYEDLLARVRGGGFRLVVLDTLRRVSTGAQENGSDMGVVIDRINEIREATDGGTTLTLAHTDKGDNDSRGYSGIEDDTDIVWHAKREEGRPQFTITNAKNKNDNDGEEIALTVRPILDSLVIDQPVKGWRVVEPEGSVAQRLWRVLTDHDQTGITQAALRETPHGFAKGTVSSYINKWVRDGRVRKSGHFYLADPTQEPTWAEASPWGAEA